MLKRKKLIRVVAIALLVVFLIPLAVARAEDLVTFYPNGELKGDYFDIKIEIENRSHDRLPESGDKVHITYTITNKTQEKFDEIVFQSYAPEWFKHLSLEEFPYGATKVIEKDVVVDTFLELQGVSFVVEGNVYLGGGEGYTLDDYLKVDIWRLPQDMPEEWKQEEEPKTPKEEVKEPEEPVKPHEDDGNKSKSYTDIPEWAKEEFKKAVDMEIARGYGDGRFGSDDPVNRAEFATFLARALKIEGSEQTPFKDEIPEWATKSISAVANLKHMKGYPDGTFGADKTITRTEAVAVVGRTVDAEYNDITAFTDFDEIPEWAREDVGKAELVGIVKGDSQGRFNPDKKTTRLEAVLMIVRALEKR